MADEAFDSLVESIRAIGVLEPLLVKPNGDETFEVVAGHRRLKASRAAGLAELPCIVEDDPNLADAIKIHENVEREELSPADEAIYYAELYETLGEDVEAVAGAVKRSRALVEDRLNLIRGNKRVFEKLAEGKIPIGVAKELNRMTREDDVLFHLDYAVRTGANVATVRQWRTSANTRAEFESQPAPAPATAIERTPEEEAIRSQQARVSAGAAPWELDSSTERRPCAVCSAEFEAWRMLKKHLCPNCAEHIWPAFLKAFRGEAP